MLVPLNERYQVWWDVNGALAVERRVGDSGDDLVRSILDNGSYDIKIACNGKKFNITFTYFKLIGFPFKFRLCITH